MQSADLASIHFLNMFFEMEEVKMEGGGRKEGRNPVFLTDVYSFQVLRHFRVTHWSCNRLQNGELLALWLQDVAFLTAVRSS